MENLSETEHLIHTTAGLLNFLGGKIESEDLRRMPFEKVSELLLRNGAKLQLSTKHIANFEKYE
jgi:hypothetical protein